VGRSAHQKRHLLTAVRPEISEASPAWSFYDAPVVFLAVGCLIPVCDLEWAMPSWGPSDSRRHQCIADSGRGLCSREHRGPGSSDICSLEQHNFPYEFVVVTWEKCGLKARSQPQKWRWPMGRGLGHVMSGFLILSSLWHSQCLLSPMPVTTRKESSPRT
jgi:hypothetical protein